MKREVQAKMNIAADILRKIEVAWQYFRIPADVEKLRELTSMWAYALSKSNYPDWVYLQAVDDLCASARAGDPPPMPGDVRTAVRTVVERIERDPEQRVGLEQWRESRQKRRDAALEGT